MSRTEANLYLPVSEENLLAILEETSDWEDALQPLGMAQIACLFFLRGLPAISEKKRRSIERVLAEIIASCRDHCVKHGLPALVAEACKHLDRHAVKSGFQLMPELGIDVLNDESIAQEAYLSDQGLWDHHFQQQYRETLLRQRIPTILDRRQGTLSAEQSRLYREFEAQKDEHWHIQGYAGTGKSALIQSLLRMFETSSGQVLVLAASRRQLDAFTIDSQTMRHVHKCTFSALADKLIPHDLSSPANRNMLRHNSSRATMPDAVIIRQLGVMASGTFSTDQIVRAVRAVLNNFCSSDDPRITEKHIPYSYAALFDSALRAVVCQHARDLWNTLLSPPSKDFKPQIRGYHKIKWAALNDWIIPSQYSHVIVDECHDLPRPVLQILARSPQARATLGDDYQNLRGRTFTHAGNIRLREMVHSVRSGREIENIVNPIIAAHPSRAKAQFHGNSVSSLTLEYYQKATVPPVPCLILVHDNWGLFEWVQRLASQNVTPVLMSDQKDLNMFVQDCIELKYGGSCPRHGQLFRFSSWDKLATAYQASSGFRRFNQLLEKGYRHENWRQTYRRIGVPGPRSHLVSLIENVRNLEFDNVMLAPDIFNSADKTSKAAFSAAIYIAVTRARQRLIAPVELRHWIEAISETGKVDRKAKRRSRP